MAEVLMPLPCRDFDPTESAGSWLMLTDAGHRVRFATPDGRPGAADDIMLTGRGIDPWGFVPALRNFTVLGRLLGANREAREAHRRMEQSREFQNPKCWREIDPGEYDGLLLPGGHRARGCGNTWRALTCSVWCWISSCGKNPLRLSVTVFCLQRGP
jgi:putative intracellular protease/amidase